MCEIKINIQDDIDRRCKTLLCIVTLFHFVCVCLFTFVSCFGITVFMNIDDELLVNPDVEMCKKFVALYLTNWNFAFQTVFLTLSLVHDVLEWLDLHETQAGKKLKYYIDILFSGVVVPATMFISTMFWTVYSIDRELVFPTVYDLVIPWWFNHCVHTNIAIVVAVETILQERRYPANMKLEFSLNAFIGVLYAIVYYSIYFFTKRWLYGVFGIMTWWQVCLYQILIWGAMVFFYFIQFPVNRIFHREKVLDTKNGMEVKSDIGQTKNGIEVLKNGRSETDSALTNLKLKVNTNEVENSNL